MFPLKPWSYKRKGNWDDPPNVKLRLTTGYHTIDGRNPANQLRLIVYPTILQDFSTIPGGFFAGCLNHQHVPTDKATLSPIFQPAGLMRFAKPTP